jgi:hypothetical protein
VAVGQGTIDVETTEDFCSEVGFEFVDAGDELAKDGSESSYMFAFLGDAL